MQVKGSSRLKLEPKTPMIDTGDADGLQVVGMIDQLELQQNPHCMMQVQSDEILLVGQRTLQDKSLWQEIPPFSRSNSEENIWEGLAEIICLLVFPPAHVLHLAQLQEPVAFEHVLLHGCELWSNVLLIGNADQGRDRLGHGRVVQKRFQGKVAAVVYASGCQLAHEASSY